MNAVGRSSGAVGAARGCRAIRSPRHTLGLRPGGHARFIRVPTPLLTRVVLTPDQPTPRARQAATTELANEEVLRALHSPEPRVLLDFIGAARAASLEAEALFFVDVQVRSRASRGRVSSASPAW
jgi:hypothetical protein